MLNVVSLNTITPNAIYKKKEVLEDGIIPDGYEEYMTSDGEIYEANNGSYYIKI